MLILQNTTGPHKALTDRTAKHHAGYARLHGHTYRLTHLDAAASRDATWAKLDAILSALQGLDDFEQALWLDADALIMPKHFSTDLGFILEPGKDIGMVRAHNDPPFDNVSWLNAGVIFMRNSLKLREYFQRVIKAGPTSPNDGDQVRLNLELHDGHIAVHELPREFNSYARTRHPDPVIKAWHGTPTEGALDAMMQILTTPTPATQEADTHAA